MSNEDKNVYITRQRERYQQFQTRKGKSLLIDEVVAYLQVSRDHAIRILNWKSKGLPKRSGLPLKYTEDLIPLVKRLYFLMLQPCSKRMQMALPHWIESYERHYSSIMPEQLEKLLSISPSTISIECLLRSAWSED